MKRKPYTVQEKEELLKSEAIEKVANSSVTYSKEFKVYAVGENMTGNPHTNIFRSGDRFRNFGQRAA